MISWYTLKVTKESITIALGPYRTREKAAEAWERSIYKRDHWQHEIILEVSHEED